MAISPSGSLIDIYNNPQSFEFQSKNLKYDKDIRGGGYSGQPFIKRIAPDDIDNLNALTTVALSLDYPIRGGSYEELSAREDFARIDRFLLSHPRGTAFLDKQAGLMLSNPRIQMAKSGGVFANQAYSDGRNLMNSVADVGTGIRHPNAGLDQFVLERFENKYEYIVSSAPTDLNRLVLLKDLKLNTVPSSTNNSIDQVGALFNNIFDTATSLVSDAPSISPTLSSLQINEANKLGINTVIPGELFDYPGGPGSLYGIAFNTIIQKATNSRNAFIDTSQAKKYIGNTNLVDTRTAITKNIFGEDVQGRPLVDLKFFKHLGLSRLYNTFDRNFLTIENPGANANDQSVTLAQQSGDGFIRANPNTNATDPDNKEIFKYTMGYSQLMAQPNRTTNGLISPKDFRAETLETKTVQSRNYQDPLINITKRVGIGDPGARSQNNRININDENNQIGQDKVNMSDIQVRNEGDGIGGFARDLIKFGFETIDNNNTSITRATFFRAFLTGYNDSHNAEWTAKRYSGRGENFYTYQGFDRDVNFNFKIAAQSKQEMRFLYKKLNYLLSTLYPNYNTAGAMRGNITKLTIGDLFVRAPGILTSLNLTVDDNYPWEIALDEPESGDDKEMLETPQIMDVAVNFKPILKELPQTSYTTNQTGNTPILLTAGGTTGTNAYEFLNNS